MRQLTIFAKYWEQGQVKTRLAERIGKAEATRFHLASLETLCRRFVNQAERRVIAFAPATRSVEFREFADRVNWDVLDQGEGDLGARLHRVSVDAFAHGATRLMLLGADSPLIPATYLEEAWHQLLSCDIVLGPAEDGGYYLLGLRRPCPAIFDNIPWGTSQVWETTLARCRAIEPTYSRHELPSWYDVDRYDDLRRLLAELDSQQASASREESEAALAARQSLRQTLETAIVAGRAAIAAAAT